MLCRKGITTLCLCKDLETSLVIECSENVPRESSVDYEHCKTIAIEAACEVYANCNLPHHYHVSSLESVDLVTTYVAEYLIA